MNYKNLVELAKMFAVRVENCRESGCERALFFSFEGESVEGVYFYEHVKDVRLRKPSFEWVRGDYAVAIAIAMIRHYGFDYSSGPLTKTIRRLGEELQK